MGSPRTRYVQRDPADIRAAYLLGRTASYGRLATTVCISGPCKYVLHIRDYVTCFSWLHALRSKSADELWHALSQTIAEAGPPAILQSDNGTALIAAESQADRKLGIKFINGRLRHPQSQGMIDRANRTLKAVLSMTLRKPGVDQTKWHEHLMDVALRMNDAKSTVANVATSMHVIGCQAFPSSSEKMAISDRLEREAGGEDSSVPQKEAVEEETFEPYAELSLPDEAEEPSRGSVSQEERKDPMPSDPSREAQNQEEHRGAPASAVELEQSRGHAAAPQVPSASASRAPAPSASDEQPRAQALQVRSSSSVGAQAAHTPASRRLGESDDSSDSHAEAADEDRTAASPKRSMARKRVRDDAHGNDIRAKRMMVERSLAEDRAGDRIEVGCAVADRVPADDRSGMASS